ncbi:MAG: hypothetical protein JEY71_15655 [Sphaerochaeta sp.]|nr:hypothetical protein [Sphaerochaeta sp.]
MIRDEDLQSSVDYSAGQKEAAYRVLVELMNLFGEYKDDILIVGGWVPDQEASVCRGDQRVFAWVK